MVVISEHSSTCSELRTVLKLVLDETQADEVKASGIVQKIWFGNGGSIPLKYDMHTAMNAFLDAMPGSTPVAILFRMKTTMIDDWVRQGKLRRVHGCKESASTATST